MVSQTVASLLGNGVGDESFEEINSFNFNRVAKFTESHQARRLVHVASHGPPGDIQRCLNLVVLSVQPKNPPTMVTISEVKGNSRENRTSAHTHIKGLGLKSDGYAETNGAGFVGQIAAREVGEG